jgi:ribosomal protein S12 methylthiotransferase accessory factor
MRCARVLVLVSGWLMFFTDRNHRLHTLDELLGRPAFFAPNVFQLDSFAAHSLLELSRAPHRYGFAFTALASAPHLLEFEAAGDFDTVMRGDGFDHSDPAMAAMRCVFEALERVWSAFIPTDRLTTGTSAALGPRALDPQLFALLSADELASTDNRFVPYSPELSLDWMTAHRIVESGHMPEVLVPALLVFPGFGARFPAQRFAPMLSTGIAAAPRYDDALLHAICEVVERDAFALSWLLRLAPPCIDMRSDLFPPDARETMDLAIEDSFTVEFRDLTRDIELPVALAIIRGIREEDPGAVALGLGCHPEPSESVARALREALIQMTNLYDFPAGTGLLRKPIIRRPQAWLDALDHLLSGTQVSGRTWRKTAERSRAQQMPMLLLHAVEAVKAAGHEVYMCDLTPEAAGDERRFVLVRALIPGLQPHLYEPDCWRLASPRLVAVARHLGGKKTTLTPADINRELNPFAWHVIDDA